MKEIPLSQGKHTLVDDVLFDYLNQWKWSYINGYAKRSHKREDGSRRLRAIHSYIVEPLDGYVIDHKNGNPLDNRTSNLRVCTKRENALNHGPKNSNGKSTSKYKGVSWKNDLKKWRVRINIEGKETVVGYFDNEEQAALAYNNAAIMHYGEFAWLNKVE